MLFSKARESGPKDGLLGFTSSTITVRFGSIIYTHEDGMTFGTEWLDGKGLLPHNGHSWWGCGHG